MEKTYLIPLNDSRKSFYCKAFKIVKNDRIELYSYNTKVCVIKDKKYILNNRVRKDYLFSATTIRHIKEFLMQELELNVSKKDLIEHLKGQK